MSLELDSSGRLHTRSPLMGESLMRRGLQRETDSGAVYQPLPDLPVERTMLAALQRARPVQQVVTVDGRKAGNLTAALYGENPGTRILRGPDT